MQVRTRMIRTNWQYYNQYNDKVREYHLPTKISSVFDTVDNWVAVTDAPSFAAISCSQPFSTAIRVQIFWSDCRLKQLVRVFIT